jgi:hypothetical protein
MTMITITCIEKISLNFHGTNSEITFGILEKYKYNNEKIKEYCINKINELYNPKYPFFFMKIADVVRTIGSNTDIIGDKINVELFTKKRLFYKLKIIGLCETPVYCLCLDTYTFTNIINMLNTKYPVCNSGEFNYNNINLQMNVPISKYELKINEINVIKYSPGNNMNVNVSI